MRFRSPLRTVLAGLAVTALAAQAPRGLRTADLDPQVRPCQDFFQYANGGWLKRTGIPADQTSWGAFEQVDQRNKAVLKQILEDAAQAQAPAGSLQQLVGDLYASGMDVAAIQRAGLAPLKPALARIKAVRGAKELAAALGRSQVEGAPAGFAFRVDPDDRHADACIAQFSQGGLGLPDRDCYGAQDEPARLLRGRYREHVARLLVLAGEPPLLARAHAGIVLAMETRLAAAAMTGVELRDPNATYHRMTPAELGERAPGLDWPVLLRSLGLRDEPVLVRQPRFFQELAAMARDTAPAQWRVYLRWRLLNAAAPSLGPAFEAEHFAFFGAVLGGAREPRPRWQRVLAATDAALGESLGRLYVDKAFSPKAKSKVLELVGNLRATLRERLATLDWMSGPTRVAAIAKLDAITVKMGYPERWRDQSGLRVSRAAYGENIARANAFEYARNLARLGRPLDRAAWSVTAPTVNAWYDPTRNEIVFPAGILQPPFFDPQADDPVNYGAIGMVIGHELIHAFDDQGRQYDGHGNLADWWAPADLNAFTARADLLAAQFDRIEVLPGLHLDGRLTLGENIADLGGVKLAFAALRKAMAAGPGRPGADGFSPEQRFFLSYAQAWRFQAREEQARLSARIDRHAPARFRVNEVLANLPEFHDAFGCGDAAPMHRPAAQRPSIW